MEIGPEEQAKLLAKEPVNGEAVGAESGLKHAKFYFRPRLPGRPGVACGRIRAPDFGVAPWPAFSAAARLT
jgi:hypothetical protein